MPASADMTDEDEGSQPGQDNPLVGALIAIGLGLILAVPGYFIRASVSQAQSWPKVEGTITSSGVTTTDRDTGRRSSSRRSGEEIMYRAAVRYDYVVDGKTYSGDRINFGQSSTNVRAIAQAEADSYKVGSKVTVRYDPGDPATSSLRVDGGSWIAAILLLLGIGFLGLGVVALIQYAATGKVGGAGGGGRPRKRRRGRRSEEELD